MATAAAACFLSTSLAAQREGQPAQGGPGQGRGRGAPGAGAEFAGPPQGPGAVPIVEVVGCLAQGAGRAWTLTNGTEPVAAAVGSRAEDITAAGAKPLGALQYRLIGVTDLNPAEHKGHKVAVKGLLIKDAAETRLNVISIHSAAASCGT